jgi:superoxide dismutase, Fe-Mn family
LKNPLFKKVLIPCLVFICALAASSYPRAENMQEGPFKLPDLPYSYDALEPYIDAQTMRIHHQKHHAGYVEKLNEAVNKYPELRSKSLVELLTNLDKLPADIRTAVRNNGGGHYNHSFFWLIMGNNNGRKPQGKLMEDIVKTFGSFENFQKAFKQEALDRFGSGWAWLIKDTDNKLKIISTPNQDSPIMAGITPILGLDVWEHAYYLKYQNRRGDYIDNWWNVVNWKEVEKMYK